MTSFFDQLNLCPQERRLVVVVMAILFVVLNMWFVWPHRHDYKRTVEALSKAKATLKDYRAEIARIPDYQQRLQKLEGLGSGILPSEQALHFQKTVLDQAQRNNLAITRFDPGTRAQEANTNAFFEEQTLTIQIQQTGESELVDFLYNLGTGSSTVRVRDLEVKPDQSGTHLYCRAVLVASYQKSKKVEAKPSAQPAGRVGAGRKT